MHRLAIAVVVLSLPVLAAATSARSEPRASGHLGLWIQGWGAVDLKAGLAEHGPWKCQGVFCSAHDSLQLHASPVVLVETPYKGWKFTGWWGACRGMKPKCVIDLGHIHPNPDGQRNIHVGARYLPVAAGFTRHHPIPLGTTASIGSSLRLRINSVLPNVDLRPTPPADAEYLAANVTLSYGKHGVSPFATGWSLNWSVIGSHNKTYTIGPDQCPSAPEPQLDLNSPVHRGQSETGYVCWTIATNDASSLELYYGTGGPHPGRTIWFALH